MATESTPPGDPKRDARNATRRARRAHIRLSGEEAMNILAAPLPVSTSFFSQDEARVLNNGLKTRYRLDRQEGFPDSEQSYEGKDWLKQKEGSCAVWAFGNALRASLGINLQEEPYPAYFQKLQEVARNTVRKPEGMYLYQLGVEARKFPGLGIAFKDDYTMGFIDRIYMDIKIRKQTKKIPFDSEAAERNNIDIIISRLSAGQGLIASIPPDRFYGRTMLSSHEGETSHAVAVVGYRVRNNYVDLQIIDPTRGVAWIGWEHFFNNCTGLLAVSKPLIHSSS